MTCSQLYVRMPGSLSRLTSIFLIRITAKFDIDKVDLEFLVRLDSDEDRRTTTSDDNFVGEVHRAEDESECTFLSRGAQTVSAKDCGTLSANDESTNKLLDDALDELGERHVLSLLSIVEVLCQDGSHLGIGVRDELVSSLLKDEAELLVVRDDTVVDDGELVG